MSRQSANFAALPVLAQDSQGPQEVTWADPRQPVESSCIGQLTLFGYNLGPLTPQQAAFDASGHVATTVSGFQVTFDGAAAPVIYTSAKQSSVIVPYSVAGKASVPMVISYNGLSSAAITVPVTDSAPGLLTANASGSGPLVAFNSDNSFNSRSNPVKRGDIIVLYGTGEGATTPLPADGEIAGSAPPKPQLAVSVTIAGQTADVIYAGGVTGITAGLLQLNVRVPATVPPGLLPVLLTVGTNTSQREGTIAVQ
jgi:trimeric autotransporter adhesin